MVGFEAMEEVGVCGESADRAHRPLRSGAHVVEYGLWVSLVGHFAKGCWADLVAIALGYASYEAGRDSRQGEE